MTQGALNLRTNAIEIDGAEVVVAVNAPRLRSPVSWGYGWRHVGGRWASAGCPFDTPGDALRDAARHLRITLIDGDPAP